MKYSKQALFFTLLILVLEIITSVIVSYRDHGTWQFSDFYTKPMNWCIPIFYLLCNVVMGLN